ncbi:MAG: sigma-54 dependent transcriptional regulator, partial [Acidobacteriota bacterium]
LDQARLLRENLALRQNLVGHEGDVQMVGMSPAMVEVYKTLARVARTSTTVLIEGESGTGKELSARAIHANSERKGFPFVAVNCGALSESLLESELFGHVRGAFTGASYSKSGIFETANRGVVFLDEIGEMSPNMQTRLLRVLESRVVTKVGSVEPLAVDIRVIAATNRPLVRLIKDGQFREDLYYRLKVVTIQVPPLRDRISDLSLLFDHFLRKHSRRIAKTIAVHGDVLQLLSRYDWPGNVRELENAVERAVALNSSGVLAPEDFSGLSSSQSEDCIAFPNARMSLDEVERQYVLFVLSRCDENVARAADVLQIDRRTLYRMLERYGKTTDPGTQ